MRKSFWLHAEHAKLHAELLQAEKRKPLMAQDFQQRKSQFLHARVPVMGCGERQRGRERWAERKRGRELVGALS